MLFIFAVLLAAVTSVMATCPTCPAIVPFFRSFSGKNTDHFYTATAAEVLSAGTGGGAYALEGIAAGIFPTQESGSTPLFRLRSTRVVDHAYTASTTEVDEFEAAGYVLETTPGFVYTNQTCNSVPLYSLFSASLTDHFYTTSASERSSAIGEGYADQGVVAYVPVPGVIVYGNSC